MRLHLSRLHKKLGVHNNRELLHTLHSNHQDNSMSALRFSPRGKEVFLLILQGMGSKQIGESLNMSVNGIKRHKDKMLWQNNCATMRELIARYYSAGREEEQ